jgi:quercetin dioxygenase-like cupin family protein
MHQCFKVSELPKLDIRGDLFDVRFISTDNISIAFNEVAAGAEVPLHQHVHETIDILQEGEMEMTIGDDTVFMTAGTVVKVPSNVPHSARIIKPSKVINIFYPVRDDFKA